MQDNVTQTTAPLVQVEGLSKKYCRNLHRSLRYGLADLITEATGRVPKPQLRKGEFLALDDITFSIGQGESIALLGPNGAGKSTLMKLLNGLIKPTEGRIRLRGRIAALTTLGAGFNPILSGRENVYINASVLGLSKAEVDERLDEMFEFAELQEVIDDPVRTYSSGMRSRLGYAIGAFLKPDLLLLDEVLAAGDRRFKLKCFEHLTKLVEQGTSIILVSHNVGRITSICDRAIVFDKGRLIFDGESEDGVQRYYEVLGISESGESIKGEPRQRAASNSMVAIERFELLSSEGEPSERFRSGEAQRLRVFLRAQQPTADLKLVVQLESESRVLATMRTDDEPFYVDERGRYLELQVFNQGMLKGSFEFVAKLRSGTTGKVVSEARAPFQIGSRSRGGIFALDYHWEELESAFD